MEALSTEGKPSRSLDLQDSHIGRYVGDLLQILPAEIVDIIFAYCEPQDIFRLRNVSSTWNSYLAQPVFIQRMAMKMHAYVEQYRLNCDKISAESTSFEDCVRNRRALLNGHAHNFEHFEHIRSANHYGDDMLLNSGILLEWYSLWSTIYVKRLFGNDTSWHTLQDEDLVDFICVNLTEKYIVAATVELRVYCWDAASFERVAVFRLSSMPFAIHASSNTILMYGQGVRQMCSIDTGRIAEAEIEPEDGDADDREIDIYRCRVEQSGFLYICRLEEEEALFEDYFDIYKINETTMDIDFWGKIDVYRLGCLQFDQLTSAGELVACRDEVKDVFNVVLVLDHKCYFTMSQCSGLMPDIVPCLIFDLKDGIATYYHTIYPRADWDLQKLIYYPESHRAFNYQCNTVESDPPGLYQIFEDTYRPVTSGQYKTLALDDDRLITSGEKHRAWWSSDGNFLTCSIQGDRNSRLWSFYRNSETQIAIGA